MESTSGLLSPHDAVAEESVIRSRVACQATLAFQHIRVVSCRSKPVLPVCWSDGVLLHEMAAILGDGNALRGVANG